jgi:chromosome segregation ATPase
MARDAEHYHDRAKHFASQIEELEAEGKKRDANHDRSKRDWELQRSQINGERDNIRQELFDTKKALSEKTAELQSKIRQHEDYKDRMDK